MRRRPHLQEPAEPLLVDLRVCGVGVGWEQGKACSQQARASKSACLTGDGCSCTRALPHTQRARPRACTGMTVPGSPRPSTSKSSPPPPPRPPPSTPASAPPLALGVSPPPVPPPLSPLSAPSASAALLAAAVEGCAPAADQGGLAQGAKADAAGRGRTASRRPRRRCKPRRAPAHLFSARRGSSAPAASPARACAWGPAAARR
jgi:hypothetical protein